MRENVAKLAKKKGGSNADYIISFLKGSAWQQGAQNHQGLALLWHILPMRLHTYTSANYV